MARLTIDQGLVLDTLHDSPNRGLLEDRVAESAGLSERRTRQVLEQLEKKGLVRQIEQKYAHLTYWARSE